MDAATIENLVNDHGPAMRLFAAQWCRSPDDAFQEMLIELAMREQPPDSLLSWSYRVLRNKAISRARAERRLKRRERLAADTSQEWFHSDPATKIDAEHCVAALLELDEVERAVVVARHWSQLTFQQISEVFELTPSDVYRKYQRAIERLRRSLNASVM